MIEYLLIKHAKKILGSIPATAKKEKRRGGEGEGGRGQKRNQTKVSRHDSLAELPCVVSVFKARKGEIMAMCLLQIYTFTGYSDHSSYIGVK